MGMIPDKDKKTSKVTHELKYKISTKTNHPKHSNANQQYFDEYDSEYNDYYLKDSETSNAAYFDQYEQQNEEESAYDFYADSDISDANGFNAENYYSEYDDYADSNYAEIQSYGGYDEYNKYEYEYEYEEKGDEDNEFDNYFNGNSNMEEQNGDLEPGVFWTMNVFAILCGVVLCFFMSCYFLRKKQGKYEFVKETDFEESASEFDRDYKYGFHPINMAMQPKLSGDDENLSENEQQPLQQNESSSSDNDEYANASDEDVLPSKKSKEVAANQNI